MDEISSPEIHSFYLLNKKQINIFPCIQSYLIHNFRGKVLMSVLIKLIFKKLLICLVLYFSCGMLIFNSSKQLNSMVSICNSEDLPLNSLPQYCIGLEYFKTLFSVHVSIVEMPLYPRYLLNKTVLVCLFDHLL